MLFQLHIIRRNLSCSVNLGGATEGGNKHHMHHQDLERPEQRPPKPSCPNPGALNVPAYDKDFADVLRDPGVGEVVGDYPGGPYRQSLVSL